MKHKTTKKNQSNHQPNKTVNPDHSEPSLSIYKNIYYYSISLPDRSIHNYYLLLERRRLKLIHAFTRALFNRETTHDAPIYDRKTHLTYIISITGIFTLKKIDISTQLAWIISHLLYTHKLLIIATTERKKTNPHNRTFLKSDKCAL